jgi:hypothetical protein
MKREKAEEQMKVPTRASTHAKFRTVAAARRWSLTETADLAIEALANREGISLPAPKRRRQAAPA